MATHRLGGFELSLPDDIVVTETTGGPAAPVTPTRRSGVPRRPLSASEVLGPQQEAADPIVAAMLEQDLVLASAFTLERAAGAPTRTLQQPSRGEIELPEDENAVLLLEQDGVYSWRVGTASEAPPGGRQRRGAVLLPATRRITFDLELNPVAGPDASRRRGPVVEYVFGRARGWLFRFIAKIATDKIVAAFERKKRTGLVSMSGTDPLKWQAIAGLNEVKLPSDRPARILLFVHGTFSSTVGSFGDLGATEWGRQLLTSAAAAYDAILGFDHRTLSDDPHRNASDLLGLLEDSAAPGLEIDAVTFSRGGLVLRCLVEYLLPSSTHGIQIRQAVFVAATNSGTLLASEKNWKVLIDLTTNLVAAGARVTSLFGPSAALTAKIVSESISTLGALVKAFAGAALNPKQVPGLAAMTPDGAFITKLNETQTGQPVAGKASYYAITSEFNVSRITGDADGIKAGLAKWLFDVVLDAEMGEPNDLVVNNSSTTTIDPGTGEFFKDRFHFDSNPRVYHTVFFTRPEVSSAISRWLGVGRVQAAAPSEATRASAARIEEFIVLDTSEPLRNAIVAMPGAPEFVVVRRVEAPKQVYHYAFRPDELREAARANVKGIDLPIGEALRSTSLRLGEDSSSDEIVDGKRRGRSGQRGAAAKRVVVIDAGLVTQVRELGDAVRSATELAGLTELPLATVSAKRSSIPTVKRHMTRSKPPAPDRIVPSVDQYIGLDLRSLTVDVDDTVKMTSVDSGGPPPPMTVYAAAEMQEEIPVGVVVPLTVQISRKSITITLGATRATGEATVDPSLPLVVQVIGKRNVAIGDPDRVPIDPRDDTTDLIFDVTGLVEGPGEIWVSLRQGPLSLLTMKLKPTVVAANAAPSTRRVHGESRAQAASAGVHAYPELEIHEITEGIEWRYRFRLTLGPGNSHTGESKRTTEPRGQYVDRLYKEIEEFWVSTKPDETAYEQRIRERGAELLDELVPLNIQAALWEVRDTLKAIQVMANEPFIPWELVHLKEPPKPGRPPRQLPEESHFLGQKGLVRWFNDYDPPALSMTIRPGRSYYVIPEYPGDWALPYAQAEIPYLRDEIRSTPVNPIDVNAIRLLLSSGSLDHFHFSGHGEAAAERAVDGVLLLSLTEEGPQFIPRHLDARTVAHHALLTQADGSKPLVMLNACQAGRLGKTLTTIGGFAEAFVRGGAGVFVGSLWSVGDMRAKDFSEAFYDALFAGDTLSAATIKGREAAREARDATWMAYVVYGYPLATVKLEP
jgi:hypothetical protein